MDVVGSEIGQKMRSAIKAKLTELGCYVDDELPDYVMVMVANKRTRAQMEDDLQLFLGENTELFVNWLHQVLKKLQEVTVTTPLTTELEKNKEKSKDKKSKEKKDKSKQKKGEGVKKSKKKDKSHRKKEEKKVHKSKKKNKHHEMIHPNVPPLLMNMEKESEPSITDVFAGQILKNHGICVDILKEDKQVDIKPVLIELKRPILPIIDPATISSQSDPKAATETESPQLARTSVSSTDAPREEQLKEITEIEAKIQGLKQKLAEQLDSMSDDEDFLNIRTEAEELMNDFAEDVFQEISQAPVATPPLASKKSPLRNPEPKSPEISKDIPKEIPETLPQIELKLPKRPVRERLGAKEEAKKVLEAKEKEIDKRTESPERFTPDREPDFWPKSKSAKCRLGDLPEPPKRVSVSDDSSDKSDENVKKTSSKVSTSVHEARPRVSCASVVRVRPRPRVAPASSLLLRAVADAHKSLLNIPPKMETEPHKVKRALVLPMRRCIDVQKIVIQVPGEDRRTHDEQDSNLDDNCSKAPSDVDKEEYVPASLTKKIINSDYVPSRRTERTSTRKDDTLIIETINIHNTTVDKSKDTQFIVTMDGFNPNAFLAKKLMTEGLLNDDDKITQSIPKTTESVLNTKATKDKEVEAKDEHEIEETQKKTEKTSTAQKKRLSNTSDESDTQVIIKQDDNVEKRKSESCEVAESKESPPLKKKRASPIVFDVGKKDKEKEDQKEEEKPKDRQRTESAGSDNHVTITTATNSHKYDTLPSLSQAERKLVWCRSFPLCRYGSTCAFQHPRCKFAAACTRRNCIYSHGLRASVTPPPIVASHVVPVANFKTISPVVQPSLCKYYPNCVNPACHFYHPKPCRYGKACANKLECNFYHNDVPAGKWRYPV